MVALDIAGGQITAISGIVNPDKLTHRVEIEALRGEFTDAGMLRDYDRFASLFTHDAVWRIPVVNVEFVGREKIRAGIERLGRVSGTTSCKPRTRAPSSLRATPPPAMPTS